MRAAQRDAAHHRIDALVTSVSHTHSGPGGYVRGFLLEKAFGSFEPACFEAVVQALGGLRHKLLLVQLVRASDRDPSWAQGDLRLVDCESGEAQDVSITDFTLRKAAQLADQPAIIDGPSGRTVTFRELQDGIRLLAGGLAARGFGPGDVLALMAPNIPEYAFFFHGAAYAGGTVTTINPTYTAGEIRHQLQDSGATMLVTISMFLDVANEAIEGTSVDEVMSIDPVDGVPSMFDLLTSEPLAEQVPVTNQQNIGPGAHILVCQKLGDQFRANAPRITRDNTNTRFHSELSSSSSWPIARLVIAVSIWARMAASARSPSLSLIASTIARCSSWTSFKRS